MNGRMLVGLLLTGSLIAQDNNVNKGAKALFYDPAAGQLLAASKTAPGQAHPGGAPKPAEYPGRVNAGLMYYIQRERPAGALERVNPDMTFRSGDRIRLHFMSNVHGRLLIAQRNPDGGASVLFPDPRVRGGDNRIRGKELAAIPSENAWFKFDDHAGEEQLLVLFLPEGNRADPSVFPAKPLLRWDAEQTHEVMSLALGQRGSKGLLI
jgi:hypothetical protein